MWRFAAAVFLSALLLFQIQPLAGKLVLPWFGGTPAVWTTCMLFFQVVLLFGYGYGHLLVGRLGPRGQARLHGAVLLLALAAIALGTLLWGRPLLPGAASRPQSGAAPVLGIVRVLAAGVGVPYFVLAATGPLLQSWFARLRPGASPYRLYALSNLGSALGLLLYPFAIEPTLPLAGQAVLWVGAFAVFTLVCGACALALARAPAPDAAAAPEEAGAAPSAGTVALWIVLAACASLLLLATTNEICQDVAVVPFLWVLPLLLYLASFVVAFDHPRWYARPVWMGLFALSLAGAVYLLFEPHRLWIPFQIAIFSLALFSACMICHGEVVRLRPGTRHLTGFYLSLAAGGALGGAFVGLVAPRIFGGYFELDLGFGLAAALSILVVLRGTKRPSRLAVSLASVGLFVIVGALVFHVREGRAGLVERSRGFFGVIEVRRSGDPAPGEEALEMMHGRIVHGFQYQAPGKARVATAYYTEKSGGALALTHHPRRGAADPAARGLRIGLVGLGVGTLAAYAGPDDVLRVYEISPDVLRLAAGPEARFSFLKDSGAKVEPVLGDGRLSLEEEGAGKKGAGFDVLVLDAFSSDAVPMHLLTREAFAIYQDHLAEGGILAVHLSNSYLDLLPVAFGAADALGLASALVDSKAEGDRGFPARWVLMARKAQTLGDPAIAAATTPRKPGQRTLLWTDDHSDLASTVRIW
jgi:hypothetical protein